jgi:hypothetical protein
MPSLPRGLYEELITEALEARLQQVGAQLHTRAKPAFRQAKAWPRATHSSPSNPTARPRPSPAR